MKNCSDFGKVRGFFFCKFFFCLYFVIDLGEPDFDGNLFLGNINFPQTTYKNGVSEESNEKLKNPRNNVDTQAKHTLNNPMCFEPSVPFSTIALFKKVSLQFWADFFGLVTAIIPWIIIDDGSVYRAQFL